MLFTLENSRTEQEIRDAIRTLVTRLDELEETGLRRAFTVCVSKTILARRSRESTMHVDELKERTMLADRIDEIFEQTRREGLLQGLQDLVLRQLRRRFGELPQHARDRLRDADVAQLETWGENLLDAKSLDELFALRPSLDAQLTRAR